MAIFHLSTTPISRADGRSAVAAAAYRAGVELVDMRTGQLFDYTRKGGVLSSEIVMPGDTHAPEREALWNAAEGAEKRKDARVAREWRVALPAELSDRQRQELARELGKEIADRYGVAVDVSIHAPDRGGDERNFHAHMLATTRQIDAAGNLGAKAAVELANKDRAKAGIAGTTQAEIIDIRARWSELANQALERAGYADRIDHRSHAAQGIELTPTKHIGTNAVGMDRRGIESDRVAEHEAVRRDNAAKIEADPSIVLAKITQMQAVFDRRDMARELNRYIDDPGQFQRILTQLENSPELIKIAGERKEDGRTIPSKFSTREMIEAEQAMIGAAQCLAGTPGHAVDPVHIKGAIIRRGTLSAEQQLALEHVTGPGNLAVIVGDAGTGKSFAMAAAREAWEAQGFRVRGCALSGKAADELQNGSGIESRTLYSMEAAWSSGRDPLTMRDVIVVDEAGMVGSRQLGRVLAAADQAGAKVVLLGDDKQLAAIEAGAGFRAITERTGAAEITEIRRQRDGWAREASTEFARGDVHTGLDAYNDRGAVQLVDSREDAKAQVAKDWLADRERGGSSIILAHANQDVSELNVTIRQARLEAGELGPSADIETQQGLRTFAAGDRLLFKKNDAGLDVKNGTLGTVAEAKDGRLSVTLDNGREVAFDSKAYNHVDHGYAVTIHKSQGVTIDRAYVLATPGMDRSLAYVAMTRHRENATMYAGKDDFGNYDKLSSGLSRERPKESTLDFAERHGIEAEQVEQRQDNPSPIFPEPQQQEGYIDLFGKSGAQKDAGKLEEMKRASKAQSGHANEREAEASESQGDKPQGRFAEMKQQAGQERVQERSKELDAESMAKLLGGHAQMQLEREGKAVTPQMREAVESRVQQGIESDPQARARLAEKLGQEPKAAEAGNGGAGPESKSQGRFAEMKQQAEAQSAAQQASQAKDDRGAER